MADLFKSNDGIRIAIDFKDSSELDVRQPWWWTAEGVKKAVRPKGYSPTRDKQARGGEAWWIEMVVDVTGIRTGEHLLRLGDPTGHTFTYRCRDGSSQVAPFGEALGRVGTHPRNARRLELARALRA